MSTSTTVTLTEKNMLPVYALYAAAGLFGVSGVIALILWLRKRNR